MNRQRTILGTVSWQLPPNQPLNDVVGPLWGDSGLGHPDYESLQRNLQKADLPSNSQLKCDRHGVHISSPKDRTKFTVKSNSIECTGRSLTGTVAATWTSLVKQALKPGQSAAIHFSSSRQADGFWLACRMAGIPVDEKSYKPSPQAVQAYHAWKNEPANKIIVAKADTYEASILKGDLAPKPESKPITPQQAPLFKQKQLAAEAAPAPTTGYLN